MTTTMPDLFQVITNGTVVIAMVVGTAWLSSKLTNFSNRMDSMEKAYKKNRGCQHLHIKATRRLAAKMGEQIPEEL